MNVAVETHEGRKVLVLLKDVASGEVIYKVLFTPYSHPKAILIPVYFRNIL